jgi:hypothetical protein
MVGLAGAAQRVWLRDPAFRLRSHLLTLLAASGMALHSYRLAVLPLRRLSAYAREHAAVAPLPELLLANGSRAVGSLWRDWSGTAPGFWIAGLLLLTLLLALAPLSYRGIRRSDMLAAG